MFTLNCNGRLLLSDRPLIMGILNLTPDSFYAGSRVIKPADLLLATEKMIMDGADIVDIGGQSTRPGAELVGVEEELKRVIESVNLLHQRFPQTIFSIDTWYARVAHEAVAAGASMVNDISGGQQDADMLGVVGKLGVPYICMHMKGNPATMIKDAVYDDVVREVLDFFINRVEDCRLAGIHDVILDPGLGFAKTHRHNLRLIHSLEMLRMAGKPLLLGISRKSTIYQTLGITPEQALNGSTVLHTLGLLHGANILRVHDPAEAREAIIIMEAYRKASI